MSSNISNSLSQIFKDWLSEDQSLNEMLREILHWMKQAEQLGIPHFGETATRLVPLRERLVVHFEREDEMIARLATSLVEPSADFDHLRSKSLNDHELLLAHVDDLSSRLVEPDPAFTSWQAAMKEVEGFFDRLKRHEATEMRGIKTLLQKLC